MLAVHWLTRPRSTVPHPPTDRRLQLDHCDADARGRGAAAPPLGSLRGTPLIGLFVAQRPSAAKPPGRGVLRSLTAHNTTRSGDLAERSEARIFGSWWARVCWARAGCCGLSPVLSVSTCLRFADDDRAAPCLHLVHLAVLLSE